MACYWISGQDRSWKPFVQNRVIEIRRKVPVSQWSHCAGWTNPADVPSLGENVVEFLRNETWFNGPGKDMSLVKNGNAVEIPPGCVSVLRSKPAVGEVSQECVFLENLHSEVGVGKVLSIESYSNVDRLFHVTAYVLIAVACFRKRTETHLMKEWIHQAEVKWVETVQAQLKVDPHYQIWKSQLDLFEDDSGLIRCRETPDSLIWLNFFCCYLGTII